MQGLRPAWKEAAWIFGLSRLVILLVSYISVVMLPFFSPGQSLVGMALNCSHQPGPCLLAWYHYDAVAYIRIAYQGYSSTPDVAFFPLFPMLVHAGGLLLGGIFPYSYYAASLLISNICFYLLLVLLYALLCQEFEPAIAHRALVCLAFYPYAMFFFAGYTESLFLLLCLAIFLLLRRGKAVDWWLAGLLGFLAALTRSTGIVLLLPLLVIYIQRFWLPRERGKHTWLQRVSALASLALIPAGLIAYMAYLGYTKGDFFLVSHVEATASWHRHLTLPGLAFEPAIGTLFTQSLFSQAFVQNLLDIGFTLIPLTVLVLGWRLVPLHYALFALAVALFSLSFPQMAEPLASQPRYMLMLFPIFAIFALWGKRPRFDLWFLALSLPLFVLNIILFITHHWVA